MKEKNTTKVKKNNVYDDISIVVIAITTFLQILAYRGTYIQNDNIIEDTLNEIFQNIGYAIGFHVFIIIGLIIIAILQLIKKQKIDKESWED